MTTATIRKKLHDYINIADDKKVEAIYIMVGDDITERATILKNEKFLDKLDAMKLAVSDPLFLADLAEIKDDFAAIDNHDI